MKINNDLNRLKKLIFTDEVRMPDATREILKTDLIKLLQSYFELREEGVALDIAPDENGFRISVVATASRIKELKFLR